MLMKSEHLIPQETKRFPCYIVMQKNIKPIGYSPSYVKHYGIERYPTIYSDDITEMTEKIWESALFCRIEDAKEISKLCNFRCNCGCVERKGIILKVTRSGREENGVTYGYVDCEKPDTQERHFKVCFDVEEILDILE